MRKPCYNCTLFPIIYFMYAYYYYYILYIIISCICIEKVVGMMKEKQKLCHKTHMCTRARLCEGESIVSSLGNIVIEGNGKNAPVSLICSIKYG